MVTGTAKFLLGAEVVTARPIDSIHDVSKLRIEHDGETWMATPEQLEESYIPVSDIAKWIATKVNVWSQG